MSNVIPFLVLLGMAGGISWLCGRDLAETLPTSMLGIIAVLFLAGVMNILKAGLYLIYGAALILPAAGIFRIVWIGKQGEVRRRIQLAGRAFTPGLLFLILLLVWAVAYHYGRIVTDWDEIAQWALAPKNMYLLDAIPHTGNSNIIYTDYPPAGALWCYFWTKTAGSFDDSYLYVAMTFLNVGLLAPALKGYRWKKWYRWLLTGFLVLVAPCAFYRAAWTGLYIDYLLGTMAALAFYTYMTGEKSAFDWITIALAVFDVIQVKSTGTFFAVVTILFIGWDLLGNKTWNRRKKAAIWVGLLAVLLLSRQLWSHFVRVHEMGSFWNIDVSLSRLNVFSTDNGVEAWHRTAFANCFRAMLDYRISTRAVFFIHGKMVPLAVWFAITAGVSLIVYLASHRDKTLFRAYVVWIMANVIFTISCAYMYYLSFSEAECAVLAAYSRYMSTVISGIWLFGVLMLVHQLADCSWRNAWPVLVMALIMLPQWDRRDFLISQETYRAREEAREDREARRVIAERLWEYVSDGSVTVFNGMTYEYNYLLAPMPFCGPLGLQVYTDLDGFAGTVPYNKYVYFDDWNDIYDDAFRERYQGYFYSEDGRIVIEPYALYRVNYSGDGRIVLQWIASMR